MTNVIIDWDLAVDKINNGRCALMIGPEAAFAFQPSSLQETLKDYLTTQRDPTDPLVYYSEDEFFSFRDEIERNTTIFQIRKFYKELKPTDIYRKIAQIPFHLIISFSPDLLLPQTFKSLGFEHQFAFYDYKALPHTDIVKPTVERPLIYNILGSINEETSLVYTYSDLFDYLEALFGPHDIPDRLKEALDKCSYFIFLGFKYERWYLKLFLRHLKIHVKQIDSSKVEYRMNQSNLDFYTREIKVNFAQDNMTEFVNTLYDKFEADGHLKTPGTSNNLSIREEVEDLIGQGNINKAFNKLKDHIRNNYPEFRDNIYLLSNTYTKLLEDIDLNIIKKDDADHDRARITKSLLELAKRV